MNEEGLGVKNCKTWDKALVAKQVWNITYKANNLLIKWVNHIQIKQKNVRNIKPPLIVVGTGRYSVWNQRNIYTRL